VLMHHAALLFAIANTTPLFLFVLDSCNMRVKMATSDLYSGVSIAS